MLKILVVDDEALARESLVNTLESMEFKNIQEAKDGIEAFDAIQQNKPDIVIADIRMPGMDGIELLTKLRETFGDIILIFVSGYDLFEYAQKAVSLGAFSYILKPVKYSELKNVLDKARERMAYQSKQQELNTLIEDVKIFKESARIITFKAEQEMLNYFERCDSASTIKLIKELYSPYINSGVVDTGSLMKLNFQLILLIYKILNQMGIKPEEFFGDEFILYNQVNACSSIDSIIKWFEEKLDVCFEIINSARGKGNKKLIEKAKQLIHTNYSSDITLEGIADYVHLSPTYFSKLFKQEVGENFVDYVINYRVNIARNLLKEGIYMANKVSKMVGFNNVKYFYKVFKKLTGFTPSKYKEI